MEELVKNYLLVPGCFKGREDSLNLNVCLKIAIALAEDLTELAYDYCYIYEINKESPTLRREVFFSYREH